MSFDYFMINLESGIIIIFLGMISNIVITNKLEHLVWIVVTSFHNSNVILLDQWWCFWFIILYFCNIIVIIRIITSVFRLIITTIEIMPFRNLLELYQLLCCVLFCLVTIYYINDGFWFSGWRCIFLWIFKFSSQLSWSYWLEIHADNHSLILFASWLFYWMRECFLFWCFLISFSILFSYPI